MTKVHRHLLVVLALVGITGATGIWIDQRRAEVPATVTVLPAAPAAGWAIADSVPRHVLPDDPRALVAIRNTYTNGPRTVWVVRAVYSATNRPETRPSIDALVSRRGALAVEYGRLEVRSSELGGQRHLNSIRVRRATSDIAAVYWYRLGDDVVTGEYELRWRLFLHTMLGRTGPLTLVRIASDSAETLHSFVTLPQSAQAR